MHFDEGLMKTICDIQYWYLYNSFSPRWYCRSSSQTWNACVRR